ncbi:MAG TPA: amino acid permease, partial [Kofleriaceae bacterium]|nr:amino acid permease [Kofleriaceae bacterium]
MREPRVQTGRRTMVMMATSLAVTASGILLCFMLVQVPTVADSDHPLNGILAQTFAGDSWAGQAFVILTMLSEGALLFVAAQAGFIDGPRVMANMALDSWMPHQFASLSERLTMRNGVYLMGGAALATLLYTGGDIHTLIVMYSINVFLTFSMSNLAMVRLWWNRRGSEPLWARKASVHGFALLLCATILVITVMEKFLAGGWITLVFTIGTILLCYLIRAHYRTVGRKVAQLDADLAPLTAEVPALPPQPVPELDPGAPTAVVLVGGYGGLGLHTVMHVERTFPGQYRQVVFISAGVIDSGTFKGAHEVDALQRRLETDLDKYLAFARNHMGWAADSDLVIGTETVAELERLCREVHLRFPRSVFFAGQLIFRKSSWWDPLLHNMTAFAVQRRLQFDGLPMVVLPVRVLN